jgi:hypothetical protein
MLVDSVSTQVNYTPGCQAGEVDSGSMVVPCSMYLRTKRYGETRCEDGFCVDGRWPLSISSKRSMRLLKLGGRPKAPQHPGVALVTESAMHQSRNG